jgi:predicted transcriptional regulator
LAELAGSTQSYLNKIERGMAIPNYLLAGRIFDALETEEHRGEKRVRDVMHAPVISFDATQRVSEATKAAKDKGVSQFPILRRGRLVGRVTTKDMMGVEPDVQLGQVMGPALPSVPPSMPVAATRLLLREEPAVLVLDGEEILGIVTSEDLL